jgi:hypothetical protein
LLQEDAATFAVRRKPRLVKKHAEPPRPAADGNALRRRLRTSIGGREMRAPLTHHALDDELVA